jgi:hypothetical protein
VLRERTPIKLRLHGIDAPESGQDFGVRAKAAAAELAFGKVVTVRLLGTDRYHRGVALVVLPDGRLLAEFAAVRQASLALFRGLDPDAWHRRGTASGSSISASAIARILAGHERHHAAILRSGVESLAAEGTQG